MDLKRVRIFQLAFGRSEAQMIAIDTNVLVRLYVDPVSANESDVQRTKALALFQSESSIYVPITVVLELAWVLQSFYEFSSQNLRDVLTHLTGLPNVQVERWAEVNMAAGLACQGLDVADALHALLSAHPEEFVSFDDKKLARRAKRLSVLGVLGHIRVL
jgi:predicted nucleic-acid-binding protein